MHSLASEHSVYFLCLQEDPSQLITPDQENNALVGRKRRYFIWNEPNHPSIPPQHDALDQPASQWFGIEQLTGVWVFSVLLMQSKGFFS